MSQYDGNCKHIAGLMLAWSQSPEEFTSLKSWKELLGDKDKDFLLNLLVKAASQSIDTTSALQGELFDEPLFYYDEVDGFEDW